jgi:streptogramin lyase
VDWGRTLIRAVRVLMLALLMTAAASAAASAAPITEFSTGLPAVSDPSSLTPGPDGNVWFVDTGAIGRITPSGEITEFTTGLNPGSMPHAIVPGDDRNLWFTDLGTTKAIGKITPAGTITETTTGLNPGAAPYEMTAGANGTLWFLDVGTTSAIGRITTSTGAIKEFAYTLDPVPTLNEITGAPDGNVYFTDKGNVPGVGKITPDGTITEATTPLMSMPSGIGAGPDGNVWFSDQAAPPAIGRVTPGGVVTEFTHANGLQTNSAPDEITGGPDGDVWFDDQLSGSNAVGRVTPAGAIIEFPTAGTPWKLVDGFDGNLWLLQSQPNAVLRVTPSGSLTGFTDGLSATADLVDTDITEGADGNVWFVDKGSPVAIGRADVQLGPTATTGPASSIGAVTATVAGTVNPRGAATTVSFQYGGSSVLGSTMPAGTLKASPTASPVTAALSALPAGSTVFYRVVATNAYGTATGAIQTLTTAPAKPIVIAAKPTVTTTTTTTVGDHRIELVTPSPSACTAKSRSLTIKLSSSAIRGSTAARVRFVSASLFVDRGVKHIRHKTKRSHGKKIRVKVTVYTANKVVRKLPAQPSLRLGGLRGGQHTLNVKLLFAKGKKTPVRKTMRVHFRVC